MGTKNEQSRGFERLVLNADPLADSTMHTEARPAVAKAADLAPDFVRDPELYVEPAPVDSYEAGGFAIDRLIGRRHLDIEDKINGQKAEHPPQIDSQATESSVADAEIAPFLESRPTVPAEEGAEPIAPAPNEENYACATEEVVPICGDENISITTGAEAIGAIVPAGSREIDTAHLATPQRRNPTKTVGQAPVGDGATKSIVSVADLPLFKGSVPRIVSEKNQKEVIVLDVGCASAVVVCTKAFMSSPMHLALVATISGARFQLSIQSEYTATEALIAEIRSVAERRGQQQLIPVINADNKHIVLYDEIVEKAVSLKATDIHFEISDAEFSKIRLRIYGRLHDWRRFPTELMKGALTAAYSKRTKSGTNSAGALSLERAMNTMTEQVVAGRAFNGRFNGYPLVNGYDVVMRLLETDPRSVIPGIQDLGYSESHINEQIFPAIRKNAGMIAIAGSTGSGKSTALRSFIYSIPDRDRLKIFGVEDPTEYINPFMRQISVQRNSDDEEHVVKMKFLSALRSVLRMDPDVLMLGEIRDGDSASLASEFNRTGHRVFTTVHGDGCVDVLARLASDEIGISPSTLAAKKYLSAVMYQKLMPVLCDHCKRPAADVLSDAEISVLRSKFHLNPTAMYCSSEVGCVYCKKEGVEGGGTMGLTVVAEILTPTDAILALIRERDWLGVESAWRSQRTASFDDPNMIGKTAYEHALYKASIGKVDPRDIESDFESFASYRLFNADQIV